MLSHRCLRYGPAVTIRAASLLAVVVLVASGCGSTDDEVAADPASPSAGPTLSTTDQAYLDDARPFAASVGDPDSDQGRDALLAIGHDWCAWRQSAGYGSISDDDFFGELLIDPPDGEGLRKAAEEHLCPV